MSQQSNFRNRAVVVKVGVRYRRKSSRVTPRDTGNPAWRRPRCRGFFRIGRARSDAAGRRAITPKTVVLDLMQPLPARWQFLGFDGKARRDEPGREGTLQHVEKVESRNDHCNKAGGLC